MADATFRAGWRPRRFCVAALDCLAGGRPVAEAATLANDKARIDMTRTDLDTDLRPEGLMADLEGCDRSARPPVAPAAIRLPNRRALAVLDQMFGYYDAEARPEMVDLSYDDAA